MNRRRSAFASSEIPTVCLILALVAGAIFFVQERARGHQNWFVLAIDAGLALMLSFRLFGLDAIDSAQTPRGQAPPQTPIMKFTRINRALLILGALASLICFLFPPWVVNGDIFWGHYFVMSKVHGDVVLVDVRRLATYQGIIASATFLLMLLCSRPVPAERPDGYYP